MSSFEENTTHTKTSYGHKIDCKLRLWGVTAPTIEIAEQEARHYFIQYDMDGEYDGTAKEKLIERMRDEHQ